MTERKIKNTPTGWEKGERLAIEKKNVHGGIAWYITQYPSFNYDETLPADSIHSIWFYEWEEFSEFIQWWFK